MSPGNLLIWGQKVKGQGHVAEKQCRRGFSTLLSAADYFALILLAAKSAVRSGWRSSNRRCAVPVQSTTEQYVTYDVTR